MGQHSEAELNQKFIEVAKLLNIYLNHFPRFEKFALAQQIRTCMYDIYALMVEGQKRYHKKTTLTNLDVRHEQLRMFVNLANSLNYFQFKDGTTGEESPKKMAAHRFLAISKLVDELGRMIGGWLVFERNKEVREVP
jgi:non-ribosomal peptide synthetase component E (peptide arylation enzyme)